MGKRLVTWISVFLALAGFSYAQEALTVEQALKDAAPAVNAGPARQSALEKLDGWIGQPNSERSPELIAYYRAVVDRVIAGLRAEAPKTGIRIYQLYSSSVILHSAQCVVAIDLDQGPNKDLHKTPEEEGVAFCMTDAQIDALTERIDYSFHTHEHSDHIDYEITRALLTRGKTVITTESAKKMWADEPWSEKIVTLKQTLGRGEEVGPLSVNVLWDHQWNNAEHASGTPCHAYVITYPDGITVATKGDINCALQLYGWLQVLAQKDCAIDAICGSSIYWKGVTLTAQIDALFTPIWLPGHNWEFEHRSEGEARGNASAYSLSARTIPSAAHRGESIPLSWGEFLDIPKHREPPERSGR